MKRFWKRLPLLLLAAPLFMPARANAQQTNIDDALKLAQAAHEPVFVDFSAVWCHSCWYMQIHVMNGPEWNALMKRVVYVVSDDDSPNGSQWAAKLKVMSLPSFVVLNPDGMERGRILGEATRKDFYGKLNGILQGTDSIDAYKAEARQGSTQAIVQVFAIYHVREGGSKDALDWYATLPASVRAKTDRDPLASAWLARMQMKSESETLYADRKRSNAARLQVARTCIAHGERALKGDFGLDRFDIVDTLRSCARPLPKAEGDALLARQVSALKDLLNAKVLPARPIALNLRDDVITLGELQKEIGDTAGARTTYDNGIAAARRALEDAHGNLDLKRDRSAADVLDELLHFAPYPNQEKDLLRQLAAAYPDDYDYPFLYGSALLGDHKPAEALPYLEHAADVATGSARLSVARSRAKALIELDRRTEAEKVVAEALKANGPWFPQEAAYLKTVLKAT